MGKKISKLEEIALLKRVAQGDAKAIRQMVDLFSDMAFSLAMRVLKNKEDAEEVTHDSFLKALDSLAEFNRLSRFSTWFYQIVYRSSLNKLKTRKEIFSIRPELELIPAAPGRQWMDLQLQDQRKFLDKAFQVLDLTDQLIVTMYYVDDLSIAEISKLTELGKSAVKMKLMRSRKSLKNELEKLLDGESTELY
ncbi:RNA polymerase sigma factor [Algoriphagus sp. Y33]|uniref:RNA polymerase sigma factor n=1 Tax=Algoriphagus sp. Y33 TaxID=2772483 RepID=UPI00177ABBB3|nr:sigma-70 family RNA polymerase sigma factor [Algoriphagus sp. Y33]